MSLAKTLWEENTHLAWAALEHRFVRGFGDGDLPLGRFQEYVAQDAFFLEAFARAYALALAQSPDRQGLHDFAELLAGVLEELKLHGKYAEGWGVELADVVLGEATLAYNNFLLTTAALRGCRRDLRGHDPLHAALRLPGTVPGGRGGRRRQRLRAVDRRPTPPPSSRTSRPRSKACWTATQRIPPP